MPQQNHLDQRAKVPRLQVAKETSAIAANTETAVFINCRLKGKREREREIVGKLIMHRYRYLCGLDII